MSFPTTSTTSMDHETDVSADRVATAGTMVCILQLNVEGLTRVKRDLVRHLAEEHHANVILLQETHCSDEGKLAIEGYTIVKFIPSNQHGIATYTCDGLNAKLVQSSSESTPIESIIIDVNGCQIANIYKPPPATVSQRNLPTVSSPSIVCGDFNSRNINWGYPDTNPNGEAVAQWAERQELHQLYDAKDHPSFYSGRHKKWTNPDLNFVSSDITSNCQRIVLDKFPRSGHCPIIIRTEVGVNIKTLNKKRWNFRKADWNKFESLTDSLSKASLVQLEMPLMPIVPLPQCTPLQQSPPFFVEGVASTSHAGTTHVRWP